MHFKSDQLSSKKYLNKKIGKQSRNGTVVTTTTSAAIKKPWQFVLYDQDSIDQYKERMHTIDDAKRIQIRPLTSTKSRPHLIKDLL